MLESNFFKNIKYYAIFQVIYVAMTIILSSIGAFFHFLLDHEISIVESWLHYNHWEILILSKVISLFLINRWFHIRLYQFQTIRELLKKNISWPDPEAPVISVFMLISYIALAKYAFVPQNLAYWYYHFVSFIGISLFFGLDFVLFAHLDEVLNKKGEPVGLWLSLGYLGFFAFAYKMSVPDYYSMLPYVLFCFSTLLYISGKRLQNWSNVVCFILIFAAPMSAFLGRDPVWGNDFSPFKIERKVSMSLLAIIWVVSYCYYKYRNQLFHSVRKFIR